MFEIPHLPQLEPQLVFIYADSDLSPSKGHKYGLVTSLLLVFMSIQNPEFHPKRLQTGAADFPFNLLLSPRSQRLARAKPSGNVSSVKMASAQADGLSKYFPLNYL